MLFLFVAFATMAVAASPGTSSASVPDRIVLAAKTFEKQSVELDSLYFYFEVSLVAPFCFGIWTYTFCADCCNRCFSSGAS
jgi:hypothetical protein